MEENYMIPDADEDDRRSEETKRVARILQILTLISTSPRQWTRAALVERFERDPRQIDKDLWIIRHGLGYEIHRTREGYHFTRVPVLPAVHLSPSEALTLITALQLARDGGMIEPVSLATALSRIESALPPAFLPLVRSLRTLGDEAPQHRHRARIVGQIQQSLAERRRLHIVYETASRDGERSERTVAPYHLQLDGQRRLLIAHDSKRDAVIMFGIDRIIDAELVAERYDIPLDFDLAAYYGTGWGILRGMAGAAQEIRLRMTGEEARRLRDNPHHPTQREEQHADGSWIISFHAGITPETARWIFQWGSGCRVLAPEELRVMVVQLARDVLALHEGEDGGGGGLSNFGRDSGNQ